MSKIWVIKNVDDKQHSPKIIFSYKKNEEESDDTYLTLKVNFEG